MEKIANFVDERTSVVASLVRASLRGRDFWTLQVLVPIFGFLGVVLTGLLLGAGIDYDVMVGASAALWVSAVIMAAYAGAKAAVNAQAILSIYMGARRTLTWSYLGSVAVVATIGSIIATVGVVVILLAPSFGAYEGWISPWMPLALITSSVCSAVIGFAVGLCVKKRWVRSFGLGIFAVAVVSTLVKAIPSYAALVSATGLFPALGQNLAGASATSNPWTLIDSAFLLSSQFLMVVISVLAVNLWVRKSMNAK